MQRPPEAPSGSLSPRIFGVQVSFSDQAYRIEVRNSMVFIVDQSGDRVSVDQLVIDSRSAPVNNVAYGVIVAVHGLPQEVAQVVDSRTARGLGVGVHVSGNRFRLRQGVTRWRVTPEGFERATQ